MRTDVNFEHMNKTKPKTDTPTFGSDFAEKHASFESLVMQRYDEGRLQDDCLQPHESSSAMASFGYDPQSLRQELTRILRVWKAKQVVGSRADREAAVKNHARLEAKHAELIEDIARQRAELDKAERQSSFELSRCSKLCDDLRAGCDILRGQLPKHIQAEYDVRKSQMRRTVRAALHDAEIERRHIEVLLAGPQLQGEFDTRQRAELRWIDKLKSHGREFVRANVQNDMIASYATTPAWETEKKRLAEQLVALKKDEAKLAKQVAAEEAELATFLDHYLDV